MPARRWVGATARILLTLLDTGVRCAEAVGLDRADCALPERRLLVRHGKGGKDRIVPFAGRCADAIAAYLADRGTAPGPLLVAARSARLNAGVRLRPNGLKQLLLRRLGRDAGIPKVHAHRFRFIRMNPGDAALAALREVEEPLTLQEVLARLGSGGLRPGARGLNAALMQKSGIERVEPLEGGDDVHYRVDADDFPFE